VRKLKADLGAKESLYGLRIGPIDNEATASTLCRQLVSHVPECLVMSCRSLATSCP
jgi:hypothetical protein